VLCFPQLLSLRSACSRWRRRVLLAWVAYQRAHEVDQILWLSSRKVVIGVVAPSTNSSTQEDDWYFVSGALKIFPDSVAINSIITHEDGHRNVREQVEEIKGFAGRVRRQDVELRCFEYELPHGQCLAWLCSATSRVGLGTLDTMQQRTPRTPKTNSLTFKCRLFGVAHIFLATTEMLWTKISGFCPVHDCET
jgi:hypothetical protein